MLQGVGRFQTTERGWSLEEALWTILAFCRTLLNLLCPTTPLVEGQVPEFSLLNEMNLQLRNTGESEVTLGNVRVTSPLTPQRDDDN